MRILFLGNTNGNTGPSKVHRKLLAHWPAEDQIVTIDDSSRLLGVMQGVARSFSCDVVVSPGSRWIERTIHNINLARKPIVCFNHGYTPYENTVNDLGYSDKRIHAIESHMRRAAAIVANSEFQMKFVAEHLDGFEGIYAYSNLGVEPFCQGPLARKNDRPIIAVSGGTRRIKGNEIVLQAIRILREQGVDCELRVYGRDYSQNVELSEAFSSHEAKFMGQVSQSEFVEQLRECSVFVMNSRHESFGLSVFDALQAGTSVLLSRNCGVAGVLNLGKGDRVEDCEDVDEVAEKIRDLLERPNARRIYEALDFDDLSWDKTARKLRDVCERVTFHDK